MRDEGFRETRVCVYKVGGSLFEWPGLFDRLNGFLQGEAGRPLLVSGGGGAADVVRDWDRVHGLGEERSHRLAIKSLGLGEALLADRLPGSVIVSDRAGAEGAWAAGRTPILCVEQFLAANEAAGAEPLPHTWGVTSDSIAAWVAACWPGDLVLLKSTSPEAAATEFVDPYFATIFQRVRRAGWVDLRRGRRGGFASINSRPDLPPVSETHYPGCSKRPG